MAKQEYPGVYVEEVGTGVRAIEGVSTSVTAFVGAAKRGPTGRAQSMASWKEYERNYGPLDADGLLGWSVYQFFANGGTRARVLRIAKKAAAGRDALQKLDKARPYNLLCVPGETNPAVIARLQRFCRERGVFLIVDCEKSATAESLRNGPASAMTDADGINAAFYFPWVKAIAGKLRAVIPPCGYVAGIYARTDASRGVWKAPAGNDAKLTGASGLAAEVKVQEAGELSRHAVNCLRGSSRTGVLVWGARTMRGADAAGSEWKYVPIRRFFNYIEQSISKGTEWAVFEPNAEPLWAKIRLTVGAFMMALFRQGAFAGVKPEQAYFVRCDRGTTTAADILNGRVVVEIGFAPMKPAEFVVLRLVQKAEGA